MLRKQTRFELEHHGSVTVGPGDHIATGGEGVVYRSGQFVLKLYHDPATIAARHLPDRLRLLAPLTHSGIAKPLGLVLNSSRTPVGIYQAFVEGEPLPRVATNDFWKRTGLSWSGVTHAVADMHDIQVDAHTHGAVMVDGNEQNWLFSVGDISAPKAHIIDVDGWSVGPYRAQAIMPSIVDHHTREHTERSDWFSWAVVSFTLFTGLHPYKGTLAGYKPNELVRRMQENKSVFSPGVRVNRAVRDWSNIPGPLLSWYESVFEHGERSPAPHPSKTGAVVPGVARVLRVSAHAGTGLVHDRIFFDSNLPIASVFPCGIALAETGALIELASGRHVGRVASRDAEVIALSGYWLVAERRGGAYRFMIINMVSHQAVALSPPSTVTRVLRANERLFAVDNQGLIELTVHTGLSRPLLSWGQRWGVLVPATTWHQGVGVEDALGAMHVVVPFGAGACAHVRVPELDGRRVVAGIAGERIVVLTIQEPSGEYVELMLAFDEQYRTYQVSRQVVATPDLTAVVLPTRVVASIRNDGELTITVPSSQTAKTVRDSAVTTDLLLFRWNERVLYLKDGAVWSLRSS